MTKKVDSNPRRPGIIRLSALGDVVHSLPVWLMLKSHLQGQNVPWVVQKEAASLLGIFLSPRELLTVDLRQRSLTNLRQELNRVRQSLSGLGTDGLLDLQGLIKTAVLGRLLGPVTWGMNRRDLREKQGSLLYHRTIAPFSPLLGRHHVIWKNLHVASAVLGVPIPESIAYPAVPQRLWVRPEWLDTRDAPVVVNVGAAWQSKRPSPRLLRELLRRLKNRVPLLLLWGNAAEEALAREISGDTGTPLCPWLSFEDLLRLLLSARVLVTADTLALHLADLAGTLTVGLFGPTDPDRNGSLNPQSITLLPAIPCRGCYKRTCRGQSCMEGLSVGRMEQAVLALYERSDGTPGGFPDQGCVYPGRSLGPTVTPLARGF